jgi:preprotein translocase subunit SecA
LSQDEALVGIAALNQLLLNLPQGARASFDKRTHRRVVQRTSRFTYLYHAASYLRNQEGGFPRDQEANELGERILNHLEGTSAVIQTAWGSSAWSRLASVPIPEWTPATQSGLRNALGEEVFSQVARGTLAEADGDLRPQIVHELGRQYLTEMHRQLMLSVITELWVEYLTQMEALRISIGLEAYAQRDPLVQYKNKAFGLFQELLANMRAGVVTRMYTYRPRDLSAGQSPAGKAEASQPEPTDGGGESEDQGEPEEEEEEVDEPVSAGSRPNTGSKNKRRRRRKH